MLWFLIDSLVTLPLLYAIMATMIEFRFGKRRSILVIGLAISVTVFLDGWFYMHGCTLPDIYSHSWLTTCIPNFLSLLYLAKYRDGSFLFIYLTECVIAVITTFLAYLFAYLLPWQSGAFPFLFHAAILAGILFVCRRLFGSNFIEAARYQGKRWFFYCILPFLCIVIWVIFSGSSTHLLDIGNKIHLPYAGYIYPQDIPVFIFLLVIVFYTVSLILIIITITYRADKDRREKDALSLQSKVLKERLFSMEDKKESLRIFRHDMRHHLSTLSGLLHSRELVRAEEYISQLDNNLTQIKQESYCTNAVIDAIIAHYAAAAQKEAIRFLVQINIADHLPVDDMDIGTVFANALENAQNACIMQSSAAERFIEVKFIQHKKQFVLDISNSFDGVVVFDANGSPVSPRKDHGIGSQSISAFVRKYNCSIDYAANNGVFNIHIIFTDAE